MTVRVTLGRARRAPTSRFEVVRYLTGPVEAGRSVARGGRAPARPRRGAGGAGDGRGRRRRAEARSAVRAWAVKGIAGRHLIGGARGTGQRAGRGDPRRASRSSSVTLAHGDPRLRLDDHVGARSARLAANKRDAARGGAGAAATACGWRSCGWRARLEMAYLVRPESSALTYPTGGRSSCRRVARGRRRRAARSRAFAHQRLRGGPGRRATPRVVTVLRRARSGRPARPEPHAAGDAARPAGGEPLEALAGESYVLCPDVSRA